MWTCAIYQSLNWSKIIKCWMLAFHFSLHSKWNGHCPFSHSTHTSLPVCGLCGTNYFTGSSEFWKNTLLNDTKPWDSFPVQPQTNHHFCYFPSMQCAEHGVWVLSYQRELPQLPCLFRCMQTEHVIATTAPTFAFNITLTNQRPEACRFSHWYRTCTGYAMW